MIGILAYGSLRTDPGELASLIEDRRPCETPFAVEFARYSDTRGGAPTLVPVPDGWQVDAELLVLKADITIAAAESALWRRETRQPDLAKQYVRPEPPRPKSVLVERLAPSNGLEMVLYTDFPPEGKVDDPRPRELAERAIRSVRSAPRSKDGISYLIDAKQSGVKTRLMRAYEMEILRLTGTMTLRDARDACQ